MANYQRRRRVSVLVASLLAVLAFGIFQFSQREEPVSQSSNSAQSEIAKNSDQPLAIETLSQLEIKGRAPKTGYSRDQFGKGWAAWQKCDTRQRILGRDLDDAKIDSDGCTVLAGNLDDPYTGKIIEFKRGAETSSAVQIDHVVALSDAWQKGAQNLDAATRAQLANDDLELLAVDGPANQQKGSGDAATWLPANKNFRCQYVARQIAVKQKYSLWVTQAEHDAITDVLAACPGERLPSP